ncbi:hypothetical protein EDB83DRAFT_149683 [Lactarius deliciosus]|nr:hypothetical protein EDB83DRAFT_149683 [Lactarius deliciosus]
MSPHGKHGLPGADHSTDQLAAITHFFNELEAKTPIKHLQKETDGNKTLLDTINALIAVGAFIAGVQAQLISVTYSNSNALGKVTNWFGFVGLTLDLIGTGAGVVRALLLQQAIRRTHRLAVRLAGQIDGARHEMREQQERQRRAAADTASVDPRSRAFLADSMRGISRVMAFFAEDGRFGVQAATATTAEGGGARTAAPATVDPDALGHHPRRPPRGRKGVHPFRKWMWWVLPHVNVEGIGRVPIASLGGGGLCLLVSVVLFASASQPHAVWVSCASIVVGTLVWSIIPTTNPRSTSASFLCFHFVRMRLADHFQEQSAAVLLFTIMSKKRWNIVHPSNLRYFQPRRETT